MLVGTLFGVQVRINLLFLALLTFLGATGYFAHALLLLCAIVTHELAHLLVAVSYDYPVERVELFPFGGQAQLTYLPYRPGAREAVVAMAGPLNNFLLAALASVLMDTTGWRHDLVLYFYQTNLIIACFNLLPVLPLDGGRIVRAHLLGRIDYARATRRLVAAARAASLVLTFVATIAVLFGYLYINAYILALFLWWAAGRERAKGVMSQMRFLLRKKQRVLEEGLVPVTTLLAVESTRTRVLLERIAPRRYHIVEVVDRDMRSLGTLTETELLEGVAALGADSRVGEILARKGRR